MSRVTVADAKGVILRLPAERAYEAIVAGAVLIKDDEPGCNAYHAYLARTGLKDPKPKRTTPKKELKDAGTEP